jgi:protein-disulfide isomerase
MRMMRILLLFIPALLLAAQNAPVHKAAAQSPAPANTNFKVSGNPNASVEIDAYTDYECPHCARFFAEFMPQFTTDYIKTGKVKFVHRDFPITQIHPHAQLAARYANAAGELGLYDLVVNQIFKTQDAWSLYGKNTGDIDAAVAQVVPPGAMQKIRELVKSDPRLDETVKKDVDMAMNVDHINSTPTIVVIKNGTREPISTIMNLPYSSFKQYLDQKISGK